jgi:hypothetical protein
MVVSALAALCAGNAFACRRFCGDEASYASRWPFLTDDHPLHFANAVSTRSHLRDTLTNAGYDPYFMSGYAKSSIWPTNALLELSVFAMPMIRPESVFKTFVWLSAAVIPISMIYAGWRFGMSAGVIFLAVVAWCLQYWSAAPYHTFQYVQFGMTAFVFSVAMTLAAGGALQHWLRTGTWAATLEMSVFSSLAFAAHPTTAVLLGVPAVAAFFLNGSWRDLRSIRQLLLAIAFVVASNYWWLVPLATLRGTWGDSPAFFKNPNVVERLADLFQVDHTVDFLLAPALVGVLLVFSLFHGNRSGVVPPLMIGWVFLLAIPAGVFEKLAFLQVGRNTLHLTAWVCLPGAASIASIARRRPTLARNVVLAAAGWTFICGVPLPVAILRDMFVGGKRSTTALMYSHHAAVLEDLRKQSPTARRVLFEMYEDRDPNARGVRNPYGGVRLSPLVPKETGLEVVGGPYMMTHYRTNFTNCGEGAFIGGGGWNRPEVQSYCRIYEIDLAVLWSQPALAFAQRSPDLFKPVSRRGGIHVYRIERPRARWEESGLRVTATFNRIEVENPQRAKGRFILPYHATAGWSASSNCMAPSTFQGADPVPFLTLVDPPEKVTLTFSPWTLGASPPSE